MAWPLTKAQNWDLGLEDSAYEDYPVDVNTAILAGCPVGFRAGSSPANCVRPAVAADALAGIAVRSADNTTASATAPNILYAPNFGDGTTGSSGAKVRVLAKGRIRLLAAETPDGTGTLGAITGLAGTQADVGTKVYYNGTGFTTSAAGSAILIGAVAAVGTTAMSGGGFWDITVMNTPRRSTVS
jgi:hypothetical protein